MSAGDLLIIGGNEEKCKKAEILRLFTQLAKSKGEVIGILPTASEIPEEVSSEYRNIFYRLGAAKVVNIDITSREQAEEPAVTDSVSNLSAVFITGGNQARLHDIISGTKLHKTLHKKWQSGMLIGGTSAGASIMGNQMIVASHIKADDDKLNIEMKSGFNFLNTAIIDQHFSQRARFGRLLNAIAENADLIGLGIDENTAILVQKDTFKVYGEHQVIVIDGKNRSFVDFTTSENGSQELAMSGFLLHTLTRGYSFDLSKRKILHEARDKE